ncbi:MAG: flagellar hook capping FlgD N-terminal domain-containing protein [Celeribacter marinus]
MTEISQSMAATTTTAAAQPVTEKPSANALSSDFETFLKMLTVQMQNQDPMNPIESTDYAVQLATFSSVEQQVQTNDLISALSNQLGVIGMSQTAGWVGMDVKSDAPSYFDGEPVSLSATPNTTADAAYLLVRNAAGTEVQRVSVDPKETDISWNGMDKDGYPFPTGKYSFAIESHAKGAFLSTASVNSYSEVIEARRDGGDITLILNGGAEISAEDVQSLREAS